MAAESLGWHTYAPTHVRNHVFKRLVLHRITAKSTVQFMTLPEMLPSMLL